MPQPDAEPRRDATPAKTTFAAAGLADTVLVKVGGSLLDLPDLGTRLRELPGILGHPCRLLIGGGEAADLIRRLHRTHDLDSAASHRLAIAAMDLNAAVVREMLGNSSAESVLSAVSEVAACEASGLAVPASWDVTSDSIAAFAARRRRCPLLLAKSLPPPQSVAVAAARGIVDPYFVTANAGRPIGWINLRMTDPISVRLN